MKFVADQRLFLVTVDEDAPVPVMRRRCSACTEPFVVPEEPQTVEAYTCAACRVAGRSPVPGWVEAWERSLAMQGRSRGHCGFRCVDGTRGVPYVDAPIYICQRATEHPGQHTDGEHVWGWGPGGEAYIVDAPDPFAADPRQAVRGQSRREN